MASDDIFGFLNDVWDLLPGEDRVRFGELWKAYEQSYGAIWMKMMDSSLASNIDHIPLYNNQRWLKHLFDATTEVDRAAAFTTNQDVSQGINLTLRYLIKFSVDGGAPVEVDLR